MAESDKPALVKPSREARVVQLKCAGLTDARVAEAMLGEKYGKISERTVTRIWAKIKRTQPQALPVIPSVVEELTRQQLFDIFAEDNRSVKLKYRDKLLDKYLPRPLPVVNVQQAQVTEVKVDGISPEDAFGEYGDIFIERWAQLRMERGNQASLPSDTRESMATEDKP